MSSEQEVTTGFVLKTTPYKENDLLVHVYTHHYGRITLLAKGVRKINSKNAAAVQEMTLSEFTFIPRTGISTLIKASSLNFYRHIKDDLKCYIYGCYMMEYIQKACEENEPDEGIYHLIETTLELLNQGVPYDLLMNKFNIEMLSYQGVGIEVDSCASCGELHNITSISIAKQGLICKNCLDTNYPRLDVSILKLFRHIVKYPMNHIEEIEYDGVSLKKVTEIITGFVEEYSGIYFQSKKFF